MCVRITYRRVFVFTFPISLVVLKAIRSDLTWTSVMQDAFPYFIARGLSARSICRSCFHRFDKKDELRVKTTLLRKMAYGSIIPCEINICMKYHCITTPKYYRSWVRSNGNSLDSATSSLCGKNQSGTWNYPEVAKHRRCAMGDCLITVYDVNMANTKGNLFLCFLLCDFSRHPKLIFFVSTSDEHYRLLFTPSACRTNLSI